MKYKACPAYMAPFGGWYVVTDERFIKEFKGPQAQLDAMLFAHLLNKAEA